MEYIVDKKRNNRTGAALNKSISRKQSKEAR
jgi:hypothetical protein